jgi:hypothetical protein
MLYLNMVCLNMALALSLTTNVKKFNCLTYCRNQICIGRKYGNYLYYFFLLVKVCYIVNILVQLYMMSVFLGSSWITHGFKVFFYLLHNGSWLHSRTFPIQTLCDYSAFQQGSLLHHQCQCVLPVNLYNDKIFAFLTLYLTALLFITILGLVIWIWRTLICQTGTAFIKEYLRWLPRSDG